MKMQILDVGSEAETCMMAGRGMNGLRGSIVCFNESSQRYTLELDSGEMMSLKARNVKAARREEDVEVETVDSDNEKEASPIKKKKAPSALPKSPEKNHYDVHTDQTPERVETKKEGNIIDRFLYAVFGAFMDMSPSVIILAVGAAYFANKIFNGGGTYESEGEGTGSRRDSSYFDDDYYYYHSRRRSWLYWPHWHWGSFWHYGLYGLSGMFSFLVVGFFIWQFGTKKGQTDFSWRHVKTRVAQFDFWEVMRYGALIEGAIFFLMRCARNMSGEGGGGDRRRRR